MLERAIKWAKVQRDEADSMTQAWLKYVPAWREMLRAFERDRSNPNPFEQPDPGMFSCSYV